MQCSEEDKAAKSQQPGVTTGKSLSKMLQRMKLYEWESEL